MTPSAQSPAEALQAAVIAELHRSPLVDEATIGVSAHSGTVALTGEVRCYAEKLAALQAALSVPGITAIADSLAVAHHPHGPTDRRIAVAASNALRSAASVPSTVQATVHDRAVTLSGEVATEAQRTSARHAVGSLPGVLTVWSTLTLAGEHIPSTPVLSAVVSGG